MMLRVQELSKTFVSHLRGGASQRVLAGVELDIAAGELVVLTGPSGGGKSSLLRCIYRTYRPDGGRVLVGRPEGEPLDLASAPDRTVLDARASLIGMVTQFLRVTPRVGAADLVREAGAPDGELLRSLGLSAPLLDAPPATFSGGERQIVNLAMALARPRPLLLLDEATASLDTRRRRAALGALDERKRAGTAMLAVFHELPDRPGLVDRVVRLREGRVVTA